MLNFGYHTDDVVDGANFLDAGLDDYDLLGIEDFSDSFDATECDEAVTDFDEKGGFLLENIMESYEIYNMA